MLKKAAVSLILLSNKVSFNLSANASTAIYDQEKSLFDGRPKDAFLIDPPLEQEPLPPSIQGVPIKQEIEENSTNVLPHDELNPEKTTAL